MPVIRIVSMTRKYGRRPRKAAYKMFSSPLGLGEDVPRSLPSAWFEKWTPKRAAFFCSLSCRSFAHTLTWLGGRGSFGSFLHSVTAVLGATQRLLECAKSFLSR